MVDVRSGFLEEPRVPRPVRSTGSTAGQAIEALTGVLNSAVQGAQRVRTAKNTETILTGVAAAQERAITDQDFDIETNDPVIQRAVKLRDRAAQVGTSTARLRFTVELRRTIAELKTKGIGEARIQEVLRGAGIVDPEVALLNLEDRIAENEALQKQALEERFLELASPTELVIDENGNLDREKSIVRVRTRLIESAALDQVFKEIGIDRTDAPGISEAYVLAVPEIGQRLNTILNNSVTPILNRFVLESTKTGGANPEVLDDLTGELLRGNSQFQQLLASARIQLSPAERQDFDNRFGGITDDLLNLVGLKDDPTAFKAKALVLQLTKDQSKGNFFAKAPGLADALNNLPPQISVLLFQNIFSEKNVKISAALGDEFSSYFSSLLTPTSTTLTGDTGLRQGVVSLENILNRNVSTVDPKEKQRLETSLFIPNAQLNNFTPFFAAAFTVFNEKTNASTADRRLVVKRLINAQFLKDFDRLNNINPDEATVLGRQIFEYIRDIAFKTTNDLNKDPQLGQTFGFQLDDKGNISIARRGETKTERVGPGGVALGGILGIGLPSDVPLSALDRIREQQLEFIRNTINTLTKFSEFDSVFNQFSEEERKIRLAELLTTNFGLSGATDQEQFERRLAKRFGRPDPAEAFTKEN